MFSTDSQARAEQGLVESLKKPRTFFNKTGYGTTQSSTSLFLDVEASPETPDLSQTASPQRPGGTTKVDLKQAARQKRALAVRAASLEIEEVAVLTSNPDKGYVQHEFKRLEKKTEEKRTRHDRAYKDYRQQLRDLSDEVELLYVKEADSVKEELGGIDQQILDLFAELDKDELLEMQDYGYVTEMWDKISSLLSARTGCVMQFGDNLESFEVTRSTTLASYLRTMVDTMVGIALKLPQEIERVAEVESFELNAVIIGNRRAHAELMARMEKEDIMEKVEAREKWEKRRYDWRQLRHARGIREFHRDITADNFTNPPSRVEVFDAFKKEQEERHQTRCDVLARLGAMDHYTLASDKVNTIRSDFKDQNAIELKSIKELYDSITKIKHEKHDEAEMRRENLRAELHNYGALHLEPDTESFALEIDAVVTATDLEEFFRKSGGLKSELVKITKILRDPNLIYEQTLTSGVHATTLVRCGRDLEDILEKQGKSSLRKAAQDTLERLRKATKSECLPILPILKNQCTSLALVNDIDGLLKKELSMAADQLQELIATADYAAGNKTASGNPAGTATAGADPSLDPSASTNLDPSASTTLPAATTSVPGSAAPTLSRAPSESNRSNRSSRRRSVSVAPSKGWEEPELDMLAVRTIQKQVGMLLAACDLSDEFKEVLRLTLEGLNEK
ncbi:hypothetical protein TeGR_g1116, partial [Tetraparma gracilis]